MGTSIRRVADFVRPVDDQEGGESAPLRNVERKSRLGDRLQGTLDDVSVDSVRAVRDVREHE